MKLEIPHYQLQEELFKSDRSVIFRALDERKDAGGTKSQHEPPN